jgi:hypothetical protein
VSPIQREWFVGNDDERPSGHLPAYSLDFSLSL